MTRGREVTGRNRWIEGERSVRDLELSGTVRAFRRERGGVCACALEGGAFHSAHRAVVGSPFAAACGQARLRTGRNDLHDRPQAVQENEANAHNPAHGAPLMPSPLDRKSPLGPFPFLPDSAVVRTNRLRTSSSFSTQGHPFSKDSGPGWKEVKRSGGSLCFDLFARYDRFATVVIRIHAMYLPMGQNCQRGAPWLLCNNLAGGRGGDAIGTKGCD